jgi:hypothetical protein
VRGWPLFRLQENYKEITFSMEVFDQLSQTERFPGQPAGTRRNVLSRAWAELTIGAEFDIQGLRRFAGVGSASLLLDEFCLWSGAEAWLQGHDGYAHPQQTVFSSRSRNWWSHAGDEVSPGPGHNRPGLKWALGRSCPFFHVRTGYRLTLNSTFRKSQLTAQNDDKP